MKSPPLEDDNWSPTRQELSSMIEHTILGEGLDEARIAAHLQEAIDLDVFGVCLPLQWVPLAKKRLQGTDKKIITVIDFPLGQKTSTEKAEEAEAAKIMGADEIDMVMDYHALLEKDYQKVLLDLKTVVDQAAPLPVKVIVETSALTKEQLAIACALVALSYAQFIKTSSGFHTSGAHASDIAMMRRLLPDSVLIKASGGIRTYAHALALIKEGAIRIGTSKSRDILQGC
jgi:deoxyribose-phosphate aldolase